MEYIKTVSRELHRAIMAHDSNGIISSSPEDIIISENVVRSDALSHNSLNSVEVHFLSVIKTMQKNSSTRLKGIA